MISTDIAPADIQTSWMATASQILCGLLFAIIVLYSAKTMFTYWQARKAWPQGRRLLPFHVLAVSAGTLILSGTATTRQLTFPRVDYGVATIAGMGLIATAMVLLDRWQRRNRDSS